MRVREAERDTYNLNSGVALYFSNSLSHSARDNGGRMPVMGCHSVMLNPDSVRRVMPPTTMMANTSVEDKSSQRPTAGGDRTGSLGRGSLFVEKKRTLRARSLMDVGLALTEYDIGTRRGSFVCQSDFDLKLLKRL